jgi:hypothetical protein
MVKVIEQNIQLLVVSMDRIQNAHMNQTWLSRKKNPRLKKVLLTNN